MTRWRYKMAHRACGALIGSALWWWGGMSSSQAQIWTQNGGAVVQSLTYQSFLPQSFIQSASALPTANGLPAQPAVAPTLVTQSLMTYSLAGQEFSSKRIGDLREPEEVVRVAAPVPAAKTAERRNKTVRRAAQNDQARGGQEGVQEGVKETAPRNGPDSGRALPLQPLLQDVLSAALDYEQLKNRILLLDVQRGGRAALAGKASELPPPPETEGGEAVAVQKPANPKTAVFLTLDNALLSARRRSPQIKSARAAHVSSSYNSLVTLGGYGPKLDFKDARGRESSNNGLSAPAVSYPDHERVDKSLTLRQPLFDLNIMAGYKRDLVSEELAAIGRDLTDDQITQEVVTVYFDLIQSLVGVSLADEFQSRLQYFVDYISSRAEGGAVSEAELQRVQAASLGAERIKFEALSGRDVAMTTLERLVGAVPDHIAFPARSFAKSPKTPEQALPLLLARNSELKANQKQVDVAFYDQAAALTRFAPKVDLEVGQYDSKNPSGVIGKTQDRRTMVTVSVNLLNGGTDYAYARAQTAKREQVEFQYQSVYEKAVERLRVYYLTLQGVDKQILTAKKEYQTYKGVAEDYDRQLAVAPKSITDLLDVNNKLYQAKINLMNLNIKRIQLAYTINYYLKEF